MALTLSLETSTDVCSVALHNNSDLIRELAISQPQAHGASLSPMIEDIFRDATANLHDVAAIAVSAGPGSYTGLRIGASTAKGLCYALGIPLLAIPTLDLLAHQCISMKAEEGLYCPMIDARRMEVYCQVVDQHLRIVNPVEAKVVDKESFAELLEQQKVFFFGNGAGKCKDVLHHPNAVFVDGIVPSAAAMGELAAKRFAKKQFEDIFTFKPFYLKEFVAKKAQPLLG